MSFNLEITQEETIRKVKNKLKNIQSGGRIKDWEYTRKAFKKNRDLEDMYRDWETDRKSTRLNSSHLKLSRMPSSA